MAHRFYVSAERISGGEIIFSKEQRNQIKNVLRLRPNDSVKVFDGSGYEYTASIRSIENDAIADVVEKHTPDTEPHTHITLVQSLPKGDKIELILQKCTEIGVSEFIITTTARSIPTIPPAKLPSRIERWRTIVKEAAEQSGRVRLPTVEWSPSLKDTLSRTSAKPVKMIAWEEEKHGCSLAKKIREVQTHKEATIFIGPEGGFLSSEIQMAATSGVESITLGSRILRAETAAIVASAMLIYGTA